MLRINFKKMVVGLLAVMMLSAGVVAVSSILFSNQAMAEDASTGKVPSSGGTEASGDSSGGAVFGTLMAKGVEIFVGLRQIIFAVSGFGIIAVAIGGFFGNLNWKWLAAIAIGLFVMSSTAAIIDYMVGQRPGTLQDVQSGLKTGK